MTFVLAHPSPQTDAKELAKILRERGAARVEENSFVVLETDRIQEIAGTFGVARVSMAIECESQFAAISKAIAEVGRRTVLQGQGFFVKVHLLTDRDFAARDLEFAATGALAAELAGVASSAKNEEEASAKIVAYVGMRRAFVCLKEYEGAGGAPAGALGSASCAITGPLSLASCIAACKAGFSLPELLLLYGDEDDLCRNAKIARSLAEKTTRAKSQKIAIAKMTAVHPRDGRIRMLQFDLAAARALAGMMKSKNVVLPLSLATHPQWFIEMIMKEIVGAGKVPLVPLMFSEIDYAKEEQDARRVTRQEFMKSKKTALEKPRHVRLEVGPDYLHDIIDSV
ncbi:hypothetical protein NTE_01750 [Candidatus Nitrososphaera evergladensis SR1]|uniref:Uncharacterized protein n=1 Tax=Candidatus Nitrososphaera evergladensis SR1 TaxID=1459636 RepID=A0A075MQK2_9ARCH|nr:hypothetical protein [Candidatus Nitrososphaera evergladensis]AIF83811.1 hypothetical protein NTE_01750 [Candidatus Nitrososphaera evergladensis SR1]